MTSTSSWRSVRIGEVIGRHPSQFVQFSAA
jgi:hypothetical protein